MTKQSGPLGIVEAQGRVAELMHELLVSRLDVEIARGALRQMCDDAAKYGLTKAEVVKAVLRPAFQKPRGCDCHTCAARRAAKQSEIAAEQDPEARMRIASR